MGRFDSGTKASPIWSGRSALVGERLGAASAGFALFVQGAMSELACGVSSFGISGTIAHAVLALGQRGTLSTPKGDAIGGGVSSFGYVAISGTITHAVLHQAHSDGGIASLHVPQSCKRRAFRWRYRPKCAYI